MKRKTQNLRKNTRLNSLLLIRLSILLIFFLSACAQNSEQEKNTEKSIKPLAEEKVQSTLVKEEAFHEAALSGEIEKVKSLLREGTDVHAIDEEGHTALMFAAFNGHTDIVKVLLDLGASVTAIDYAGRTALMFASTGPFPQTVELLLKKKSEPNAIDKEEHFTPLMHAAAEGHLEVVKVLMENGADPKLTDVDGDTAESFARQNGHQAVADYIKSEMEK